ncbi:MAG: sensor histidine kinase [Solirubrobacteraceae bacterium]
MLRGLRGRLVALLALVCAAALGLCALALLPPLEQRLINDETDALVRQGRQLVPELADAAAQPPRPSAELSRTVRTARRRGGAEIIVVAPSGAILASTDLADGERFSDAVQALRGHVIVHGTAGTGTEAEVQVAVPTNHGFALALRKPLDDVRSAVSVVRNAFLVAASGSLVVALLVGVLLAGRVVRRLRRLRDTALDVARLGPDAEFRADTTRDEVGDLTRAFAAMQAQLREQEDARRAFVANASHEMRTPLTSLRVMLDVLRGDLDGPIPDLNHARLEVERADHQAERLSTLAADLLDLSRLDAGVPLRSEPVILSELVRSVAGEFEVRVAETARTLDLDVASSRWAAADPGSTAQVIRILIDNALRHTEGPVRVAVGTRGEMVTIAVQDHGPGVPLPERERIFARFERGASAGPGFGLGLAIGRELARRMGGDLQIDSEAGTGSRFVLSLPEAPAP